MTTLFRAVVKHVPDTSSRGFNWYWQITAEGAMVTRWGAPLGGICINHQDALNRACYELRRIHRKEVQLWP